MVRSVILLVLTVALLAVRLVIPLVFPFLAVVLVAETHFWTPVKFVILFIPPSVWKIVQLALAAVSLLRTQRVIVPSAATASLMLANVVTVTLIVSNAPIVEILMYCLKEALVFFVETAGWMPVRFVMHPKPDARATVKAVMTDLTRL